MATNPTPTRKVGGGGIGGSAAVLIIFIAQQLGLEVPAEVAAAFVAVIMFVVSYLIPEKENYREES